MKVLSPAPYGTVGVPSTANAPGARTNAVSWIDSGGNLWLFGGQGYDSTGTGGYLNDLWEFNPTSKTWTWVSGSSTLELFADGLRGEPGVYGTQGIPNGANVPCGRLSANSWIDSSGNLWLFGGYGQATPTSGTGVLNDQWEFNPTNKQWTWVGEYDTPDQPGVYARNARRRFTHKFSWDLDKRPSVGKTQAATFGCRAASVMTRSGITST